MGGSKKLKKPSDIINGCSLKPPTHGHPWPKWPPKDTTVPVFQWRASCCLSWEAGMVTTVLPLVNMYAPAWRCTPASMTSRLHHHLHLVLIIIFAALMDAILVYGYLKWAHPWAGILGTEFVVPFSSLSSSLKSSTFLRGKHHYLNESITIFPSNDIFFTQYLFLNKKKVTFSWRLESKRTRGKSNHKFRRDALAENEETENFDGAEAVPNPEPQQILNADADPGNNLTIASCC